MNSLKILTLAAALALSGCAASNPYLAVERAYYPEHFNAKGQRLSADEITKLGPRARTPENIARYRAYCAAKELVALEKQRQTQQAIVGLGIVANSLQQTSYQIRQQALEAQAASTRYQLYHAQQAAQFDAMQTNFELQRINNNLSGINRSLRYMNVR